MGSNDISSLLSRKLTVALATSVPSHPHGTGAVDPVREEFN